MSETSEFSGDFGLESHDSVESQLGPENICGTGATCTVYRIRQDGVLVALKRLNSDLRHNSALIAAYRKEFEIGRKLRHEGLPVFRKLRADQQDVYIIEDFIDGVNLQDFLSSEDGKAYFQKEKNVSQFLSQLLDVVTYLHRSGIIHCDLKPENIMLRHTDRAAMLIDLDKAYCDTHDLTHGGTPGISDPLQPEVKPTAAKDFAAIGRIAELISDPGKWHNRKFRRFRNLCNNPDVSTEQLQQALKASANKSWTVTGIVIACIAIITLASVVFLNNVVFINNKERSVEGEENLKINSDPIEPNSSGVDESSRGVSEPSILTQPQEDSALSQDSKVKSPRPTAEISDFDTRMTNFIKTAEAGLASLRSGNLPDEALQQLAGKLETLWTSSYNKMLDDYRQNHPDASEAEVYQAVINASGSSKALRIMNAVNNEMLDTLRERSKAIKF